MWAPISMTGVLLKRGHLQTDTQGECHMKMMAESWVMLLQGKEKTASKSPEARERHGTGCPSEGTKHYILILGVQPPELRDNNEVTQFVALYYSSPSKLIQ